MQGDLARQMAGGKWPVLEGKWRILAETAAFCRFLAAPKSRKSFV
jgi:hypothetical protein